MCVCPICGTTAWEWKGRLKNAKANFTRQGEHLGPLPLENTSYGLYRVVCPSHLLSLYFSLNLSTSL